MLIDAGGARIRDRERFQQEAAETFTEKVKRELTKPTVTVVVTETHDGDACDCIDKTLTLEVGQELELEHVCHDGRVDKVIAKVTAIDHPKTPEHGKARVMPPSRQKGPCP